MSQNPPQTLSVKRKRTEAPVDSLRVERTIKKHKSKSLNALQTPLPSNYIFRRLTKPNDAPPQQFPTSPTPTTERRFQLDASARAQQKRVFMEIRERTATKQDITSGQLVTSVKESVPEEPSRPQKRPGAGSALRNTSKPAIDRKVQTSGPSAQDVQQLEALSRQVEKEDNLLIPAPSPSKFKPKPPAQRFAERNPARAAALAAQDNTDDGDAMEIDSDEYVIDTYVREPIMPDADGKLPEPTGTVGVLVIGEEDEDWWNGEDESDKEFDTDDEDENAEDYYANDYPEDELDEDDEYDRNLYQKKYRHGSDDEEYNLDDGDDAIGSDEDEDDLHFKMTVPKVQRPGYWGAVGEA
jgi:hypothetical protein